MKRSLIKCIKSFRFAINGALFVFKNENNMRFHFLAIIIVLGAGIYFKLTSSEYIIIVFCIGIVLVAELFNTAIEKLVDFISPGYNFKAGLIKDISSGAVLIAAIMSIIIAAMIFYPKIW